MDITLKVKPEALKAKASEVEAYIKTLESEFDSIQDIISRTKSYWTRLAGDKARSEFLSQKDDTRKIIQRFKEHPPELLTMAGIYEEAERDNAEENRELVTDMIV